VRRQLAFVSRRKRVVLTKDERGHKPAESIIPQEIAWRIFPKGIARNSALSQVTITGNAALALPVLAMISIIGSVPPVNGSTRGFT